MGATNVDLTKDTRRYLQTYALNDADGVKALLRDRHKIAVRRYSGDTAASDILIDLHSAIESSAMSERQAEAIALVYGMDVTQAAAARIIGVSREAVTQFIDGATEKIAAVYKRWDYGEISVELAADNEENCESEAV